MFRKGIETMETNHLELSISIVSYNDKEFLREFLKSIYENTTNISFEVLVINNGSKDGVVDMIQQEFPQVSLIVNNENKFFTYATNQNLRRAKGEFIVYLSSDTLVSATSFGPMIKLMHKDPSIGVVGPVIYDFAGKQHSPGQKFPTVASSFINLIGFHRIFPNNLIWKNIHYRGKNVFRTFEVESVSGACLMTRKAVVDQIGLLDENLVMYYDEDDFCRRVRDQGWKVMHCGDAEIKHYGGGSTIKEPLMLISQLFRNSFFYLHKKYYGNGAFVFLKFVSNMVHRIVRIKQLSRKLLSKEISN